MILFKGWLSHPSQATITSKAVNDVLTEWEKSINIEMTTSGSTGSPKAISIPKNLIQWSAKQTFNALSLQTNERVLVCIPIEKIGGRMLLYRSLIFNWFVQIQNPTANPLIEIDLNHGFTFISLVPFQLATIFEDPNSLEKLKQFKHVLIGGAAMSGKLEHDISDFVETCNVQFYHSYGMTETASHIALRHVNVAPPNQYKLLSGVTADINKDGNLSITITEMDWTVDTNDVVSITDNFLQFNSRTDEVVNSGGLKLHLQDIREKIELSMKENNCLIRFILWKANDDKLGEKLVFVGLKRDYSLRIEKVAAEHLTSYEIPKNYFWVEAFSRTESGKIDRQKTVDNLIEIGG